MSWINRLYSIFPGFGNPFVADAVYQSVGNLLTTSETTSLTALSPTISRGRVRVKIYGGTTSPTLKGIQITLSDAVGEFVTIYNSGVWATAITLSATPAGVALGTDGAMSATGIKVLTSATGAFTPAMVGATIAVSTAGNAAGTIPLYTTIASYQSPTQVTLAAGSVKTTAVSGATITLTESYLNTGTASAPAGIDFTIPFIVDIAASRLDVVTTSAGTSFMDLEISGTN